MDIRLYQTLMAMQAMKSLQTYRNTPLKPQTAFSSLLQETLQQRTKETTVASRMQQPLHLDNQASSFAKISPKAENISSSETPADKHTPPFSTVIQNVGDKYGVDPAFIRAVIQHESGFNANSKSEAGALGLMQLMPGTAKALNITDPLDPKQNIEGGTRYLKQMLDRYNQDKSLALAAYNAGPGNVDQYSGIPPFAETQNYVENVLHTYNTGHATT